METNHSKYIDDYVVGNLKGQDLIEFEKELAVNLDLQLKVEFCKNLREAILGTDERLLREKLNIAQTQQKRTKKVRLLAASIVAAASILIAIGFYFIGSNSKMPSHIFAQYYKPFQPMGEVRNAQWPKMATIDSKILGQYTTKERNVAITSIEKFLESNPNNTQAMLMLACCYLETEQFEHSESLLKQIIESNNEPFYAETAQWYMALALLKQEKAIEAKELFTSIARSNGYYSVKAKAISELL